MKFTIVDSDGSAREIEASEGQSVMEAAVLSGVAGIVAECNGNLACATCHVYLDAASAARLPAPDPQEEDMLDFTASERREESRLSCQVKLTPALEGMVVTLPPTQV